jgi:hypothetical protein
MPGAKFESLTWVGTFSCAASDETRVSKRSSTMTNMKLLSVNVSLPREVSWKRRTVTTAIFKRPVVVERSRKGAKCPHFVGVVRSRCSR